MYKQFNIQFLYHLISSWFLSPLLRLRRSLYCALDAERGRAAKPNRLYHRFNNQRTARFVRLGKICRWRKNQRNWEQNHFAAQCTPVRISFSLRLGSTRGDNAHIHSAQRVVSKHCWYQKSTGDGSASACFRLTSSPRFRFTLTMLLMPA